MCFYMNSYPREQSGKKMGSHSLAVALSSMQVQ